MHVMKLLQYKNSRNKLIYLFIFLVIYTFLLYFFFNYFLTNLFIVCYRRILLFIVHISLRQKRMPKQ